MRRLVPEQVQTSAMDCGPACLKALAEGLGVRVGYGRLREACQTDVDGTSISTLAEVAGRLGLDAAEVMLPPDALLVPEARALPALVVVAQPSGATHFVVVWSAVGPLVQIMDPAVGRVWVRRRDLLARLHRHAVVVPAGAWRSFAESPDALPVLDHHLGALGIREPERRALIAAAQADPTWAGFAALDAACRMVRSMVRSGGLRAGAQAERALRELVSSAEADVPEAYWAVRPAGPDQLRLSGAVLIRVRGRSEGSDAAGSTELAAALGEPRARPLAALVDLAKQGGVGVPGVLLGVQALAAVAVLVEILLLRSLIDLGPTLGLARERLAALAVIVGFAAVILLLEWPVARGAWSAGRSLELRTRVAFAQKLPRLRDRYFASRPVSDMADRGHALHRLRELPELARRASRAAFELLATTAALIWLDPSAAPLAVAAAAAAVGVPLAFQPALAAQDLRARTHLGALGRFQLDALLGLTPIRTHSAERTVRASHQQLLVRWGEAGLAMHRTVVALEGVGTLVGYGLAAAMVLRHAGGSAGVVLLLVFWALRLPALGRELAVALRQYPAHRTTALRVLEPLGAPESDDQGAPSIPEGPVAVGLEGVVVVAGGHVLLREVDLRIEPGTHVAIVGPSGAGKSTLLGLLLGRHEPVRGRVTVSGEDLTAPRLAGLRRRTAVLDPSVRLWNRSLLENLEYGAEDQADLPVAAALADAELLGALERLDDGLQTRLGEGGGRLSGGEGQRVRLGRALLRPDVGLALLDEAFRGLDRPARERLLGAARRRWADATMLCATHDIGATRGFDRVLVVDGGRIVEDGAPAELATGPTKYAELLAAEDAVRDGAWADPGWRRLTLAGGALREGAA